MTDYSELVKALRCCKIHIPCKECPKYKSTGSLCVSDLHDDAAAAIEELQAEQKKTVTQIFGEEQMAWEGRCKDLLYQIADLQAQLPKRGKWVGVSPMVDTVQCSVCGGQLFSEELETPYCPYCGAKMEVQE